MRAPNNSASGFPGAPHPEAPAQRPSKDALAAVCAPFDAACGVAQDKLLLTSFAPQDEELG